MGWTKASSVAVAAVVVTTQRNIFLNKNLLRLGKAGSKVLGKICWTISCSPSSNKVAFKNDVSVMFFLPQKKTYKKRGLFVLHCANMFQKNLPNRESESKQYWDFTSGFGRIVRIWGGLAFSPLPNPIFEVFSHGNRQFSSLRVKKSCEHSAGRHEGLKTSGPFLTQPFYPFSSRNP